MSEYADSRFEVNEAAPDHGSSESGTFGIGYLLSWFGRFRSG